jgi:hypothetical protein
MRWTRLDERRQPRPLDGRLGRLREIVPDRPPLGLSFAFGRRKGVAGARVMHGGRVLGTIAVEVRAIGLGTCLVTSPTGSRAVERWCGLVMGTRDLSVGAHGQTCEFKRSSGCSASVLRECECESTRSSAASTPRSKDFSQTISRKYGCLYGYSDDQRRRSQSPRAVHARRWSVWRCPVNATEPHADVNHEHTVEQNDSSGRANHGQPRQPATAPNVPPHNHLTLPRRRGVLPGAGPREGRKVARAVKAGSVRAVHTRMQALPAAISHNPIRRPDHPATNRSKSANNFCRNVPSVQNRIVAAPDWPRRPFSTYRMVMVFLDRVTRNPRTLS